MKNREANVRRMEMNCTPLNFLSVLDHSSTDKNGCSFFLIFVPQLVSSVVKYSMKS